MTDPLRDGVRHEAAGDHGVQKRVIGPRLPQRPESQVQRHHGHQRGAARHVDTEARAHPRVRQPDLHAGLDPHLMARPLELRRPPSDGDLGSLETRIAADLHQFLGREPHTGAPEGLARRGHLPSHRLVEEARESQAVPRVRDD